MRKIGIIGLGYKAESMINLVKKVKSFNISGIYDTDEIRTKKLSDWYQLKPAPNPFALISDSDLLIISKTDSNSYNLIIESILNAKHVIIENPIELCLNELDELIKLSSEASVSVVPFLPFRFSTCLVNTKSYVFNPLYIELRCRMVPEFKRTKLDMSQDLLNIIDLVFNLIKARVKKMYPIVIRVLGQSPQVINIRLEFDNGSYANINLDYLATRDELTLNVFQKKQIVSIDLIKNSAFVKTFNRDNLLDSDVTKPVVSKDENPYAEILNYLNAFENFDTPVSILENFRYTLSIFSELEGKIR